MSPEAVYEKKYSIAVDFDGVLHQYINGWVDPWTINDPPMPGAFDWLTQMVERFNVYIYSARFTIHTGPGSFGGGNKNWLEVLKAIAEVKAWMLKHGLPQEIIDRLYFWHHHGKPTALVYIDDRGYRFKGHFPSVKEIHQDLRPWKCPASEPDLQPGLPFRKENTP